jgi:hypothetical protein
MEIERVEPSLPRKRGSREPWHAVSIASPESSCPEAESLKGRRFLSNEAPRLPLAKCAQPWNCRCVYRHHPDRRATPRRASDRSGLRTPRPHQEQRSSYPRRGDDL